MTTLTQAPTESLGSSPHAQNWSALLQQLLDRQSLSVPQAADLMQGWLSESIPDAISGAILAAMQAKGISATELVGMVQVLRTQALSSSTFKDGQSNGDQSNGATAVPASRTPIIDTCGTGGDGASTFNISTAVAFVAAAAGAKVAKHGNRSASSKAGSADVLEALGVNLTASPERVVAAVEQVGITFLFAPGWHPAFKVVAPLRKTLKVRTIFNVLGPLLNPLNPTGQVIGVCDPALVETIALAMCQLETRRGVVVYGREHLDEAGLADLSDVAILTDQTIQITAVNPQHLGLEPAPTEALRGGDVQANAEILKAVLQGQGTQAQRDAIALNAAMALYVGEAVAGSDYMDCLTQGVAIAQEVLSSGAAWTKLEQLAQFLR